MTTTRNFINNTPFVVSVLGWHGNVIFADYVQPMEEIIISCQGLVWTIDNWSKTTKDEKRDWDNYSNRAGCSIVEFRGKDGWGKLRVGVFDEDKFDMKITKNEDGKEIFNLVLKDPNPLIKCAARM
jgi:hypothetical protein